MWASVFRIYENPKALSFLLFCKRRFPTEGLFGGILSPIVFIIDDALSALFILFLYRATWALYTTFFTNTFITFVRFYSHQLFFFFFNSESFLWSSAIWFRCWYRLTLLGFVLHCLYGSFSLLFFIVWVYILTLFNLAFIEWPKIGFRREDLLHSVVRYNWWVFVSNTIASRQVNESNYVFLEPVGDLGLKPWEPYLYKVYMNIGGIYDEFVHFLDIFRVKFVVKKETSGVRRPKKVRKILNSTKSSWGRRSFHSSRSLHGRIFGGSGGTRRSHHKLTEKAKKPKTKKKLKSDTGIKKSKKPKPKILKKEFKEVLKDVHKTKATLKSDAANFLSFDLFKKLKGDKVFFKLQGPKTIFTDFYKSCGFWVKGRPLVKVDEVSPSEVKPEVGDSDGELVGFLTSSSKVRPLDSPAKTAKHASYQLSEVKVSGEPGNQYMNPEFGGLASKNQLKPFKLWKDLTLAEKAAQLSVAASIAAYFAMKGKFTKSYDFRTVKFSKAKGKGNLSGDVSKSPSGMDSPSVS